MSETHDMNDFSDDELANAIQAYLWDMGYGRIDTYNNIKIITNDYGAMPFDLVFDETLNKILFANNIDPKRLPAVKAMAENLHNTLIDLEEQGMHAEPAAPVAVLQ